MNRIIHEGYYRIITTCIGYKPILRTVLYTGHLWHENNERFPWQQRRQRAWHALTSKLQSYSPESSFNYQLPPTPLVYITKCSGQPYTVVR